jgi:hypothetical protein
MSATSYLSPKPAPMTAVLDESLLKLDRLEGHVISRLDA